MTLLARLDGPGHLVPLYEERLNTASLAAALAQPGGLDRHYSTHLRLPEIMAVLPRSQWQRFSWVASVRCPFERQPSLFRYLVKRGALSPPPAADCWGEALLAFLRRPVPGNRQCRHFHDVATAAAALAVIDSHDIHVTTPTRLMGWMAGAFAGRHLAPLAPCHVNRTREVPICDHHQHLVRAEIAQRFDQDILLHQQVVARDAGLSPSAAGMAPVPEIQDLDQWREVVGGPGRFTVFGAGAASVRLLGRLRGAGLEPVAFLNSHDEGDFGGVPLRPCHSPILRPFHGRPVLIAATAYGPAYRTLTQSGFNRLYDGLAMTLAL